MLLIRIQDFKCQSGIRMLAATAGNLQANCFLNSKQLSPQRKLLLDDFIFVHHSQCCGCIPFLWLGSYGAAIPPIDDFGPTVNFEEAFDGEQGIGFDFRPAASRLTEKYGMHPPKVRTAGKQPGQTL